MYSYLRRFARILYWVDVSISIGIHWIAIVWLESASKLKQARKNAGTRACFMRRALVTDDDYESLLLQLQLVLHS